MCDGTTYMHLFRSLDKTLSKKERDAHKKMYKQGRKQWRKGINKYNKKQAIIKKFAGTKYRALVFAYNFLNKKTVCEQNIKQGIMSYIKGEREAVALPVIKRAIAISYARTLCYKLRQVNMYKTEMTDFEDAETLDQHIDFCDLAIKTHQKALKNIPSALVYKVNNKGKTEETYRPLGWYSYCPPSWNGNQPYKKRETMICEGVEEIWCCLWSFRPIGFQNRPQKKGGWSRRTKDHTKVSIRIGWNRDENGKYIEPH